MKRLVSKCLFVYVFLFAAIVVSAKDTYTQQVREGDIIFQKLPCGGLCEAIIATTPCKPGLAFNHCGIVHFHGNEPYVIEAIGAVVHESALSEFIKRDTDRIVYTARIRQGADSINISKAIAKALAYIGVPYDDAFLPGDKALYCSELVWECYATPAGKPLFSLQPMTFKSPETNTTFPAWTAYYNELKVAIPEGIPGINPCAIANADFLQMITYNK